MTFTITPEKFDKVPAGKTRFKSAGPAPFGLDQLDVGQSAFIPIHASENATKLAQKNTTKALYYLGGYIRNRFSNHRDLKGRKIVIRNEALGIRVYRIS